MLLEWQKWASRYDAKTVAAHLRAIRQFEDFCGHKPFGTVTNDDASAWRAAITSDKTCALSVSTIRHQASYLRAFFDWLSKHQGYRALISVPAYLELPRRFRQNPLSKIRGYADISEAARLLEAMPKATLKERRARALFASAYVTGLRANALITLRVRHVDAKKRHVFHDGTELRAKNGKSFVVNWFPCPEPLRQELMAWLEDGTRLGLGPEDALFPELNDLVRADTPGRAPFAPMKSASAVTEAFALACAQSSEAYSPHSARSTLAQLGDRICRDAEQRKAWSLNLGHNSEEVTWSYYGKVSDTRRGEIFDVLERDHPSSPAEMQLMLAYHEHALTRGSPEFEQAEALVEKRRSLLRRA